MLHLEVKVVGRRLIPAQLLLQEEEEASDSSDPEDPEDPKWREIENEKSDASTCSDEYRSDCGM